MVGGSKKIPFTPEQISEMRRLYMEEGETLAFIAKKFGVSSVVIRNRLDSAVEVKPLVSHQTESPASNDTRVKAPEPEVKPKPKRRIVGVNI